MREEAKLFKRVLIAVVLTCALLYPGFRKMRMFKEQVAELEGKIEAVESRNRQLREQIRELREDAFFLEKRARDMGLIKEGERVFRVEFREQENEN